MPTIGLKVQAWWRYVMFTIRVMNQLHDKDQQFMRFYEIYRISFDFSWFYVFRFFIFTNSKLVCGILAWPILWIKNYLQVKSLCSYVDPRYLSLLEKINIKVSFTGGSRDQSSSLLQVANVDTGSNIRCWNFKQQ